MWRLIRISVLLAILAFVALGAAVDRFSSTKWTSTLWVGVFPVNGDGRDATDRYIASLSRDQFTDIERFFNREARAFGIVLDAPVHLEIYPQVSERPPVLDPDASLPGRVWWSLRARYYSWHVAGDKLARIRVFVLYHDPGQTAAVPHSLGLQKGLLGIVHAYADEGADATNSVVIAHELMHTLGATDKYDPATALPVYPQGYGEPDAEPRYPQSFAEIMAGRIALSPREAEIPRSLAEVVVGPETAQEINWIAD
jgi:hypothetical protein